MWAHGERTKESRSSDTRQLRELRSSKNMLAQSLNWHGASRADSLQAADYMSEQTNTQTEIQCIIIRRPK